MFKSIDINNFKNKIGDISIIDIRSIEKYNSSNIPTSINIPSEKLILEPSKYLIKGKDYYIYCQHGKTSIKVCSMLSRLGYKVINVVGGYEAWLLS
ncbi:MAG TPA: rhodanese-like domain-containing protein [Bacilli bacterium]|nr:rhodanese-like domain-containing protein [Bacilli bacterium]